MTHVLLHFVVPLLVAVIIYRQKWFKAWLIMVTTMLIDLDHLLALPIYEASRCSIGFHPLHHPALIGLYLLLACFPKSRLIGIGLMIHMMLDSLDCRINQGVWFV